MGERKVIGVAGWRVSFLIVASISLLLGMALYFLVHDPHHQHGHSCGRNLHIHDEEIKEVYGTVRELFKEIQTVFSVKTFWVIVAQGVVGSTPWAAMLFFTLWMELLGFTHFQAAFNVALFSIGNAIGSVFGGWVGDKAAAYFPDAGRIICSQFSAGVGIPLSGCLLLGLPKDSKFAWAYSIVLFFMGFLMSWNSPATNWPIFSEIVPPHLRTTVYAIDMAFENSIAAIGTPLVGFLSEHVFGFKKLAGQSKIKQDQGNAQALARGLFVCIAVPFTICVLIVSLLYLTYPKDRDLVKIREYSSNMFEMESTLGKEEAGDLIGNRGRWSVEGYEAE
ncbi:hypothetical protein O6H91_Y516900 [Diphasiastrum complanatum]|nr:hypothetical protein O6H91_Y516900 [Diphasiastrum complanatum]